MGDLLVLEHACLNILPIIGHIGQPAWGEQICHRLLVLILTHGTRSPPIIFRCGHGRVTPAIRKSHVSVEARRLNGQVFNSSRMGRLHRHAR